MGEPFLSEIRIMSFNFAPRGWAMCNGQLLPIAQNQPLFSLLGTFYGGDGKSTFALPDFQDQAAQSQGQGQGLSEFFLGEQSGAPFVTLLQSEMPAHTHNVSASNVLAEFQAPTNQSSLARSSGANAYQTVTNASLTNMSFQTAAPAGGSLPHNNLQPYLVLNFCIALQGVFPARP